eukprot:Em0006g1212a
MCCFYCVIGYKKEWSGSGYKKEWSGSGYKKEWSGSGYKKEWSGSGYKKEWSGSGYKKEWSGSGYKKEWSGSGYKKEWSGSGYKKEWSGSGYKKEWSGSGGKDTVILGEDRMKHIELVVSDIKAFQEAKQRFLEAKENHPIYCVVAAPRQDEFSEVVKGFVVKDLQLLMTAASSRPLAMLWLNPAVQSTREQYYPILEELKKRYPKAAPVQATSLPRIAVPQFHPQLANQSNLSTAAAATLLNTILVAKMLERGGSPSPHNDSEFYESFPSVHSQEFYESFPSVEAAFTAST